VKLQDVPSSPSCIMASSSILMISSSNDMTFNALSGQSVTLGGSGGQLRLPNSLLP
jgi:hypothetical protein